jgi:prepilin-type N-terminal cleavage/methylation domain-containing protein
MRFALNNRKRRPAFTLVELLVVIAIIGVLVALLLPAIQVAREASRRAMCISQIKQLALGCLNHHDTQKHFPTCGWGWGSVGDPDRGFGDDQPGGWIFNLLPYIEQQALHNRGSDSNSLVITAGQLAGAADVLEQPISIINCPSRRPVGKWPVDPARTYRNAQTRNPRVAGRSDYAINSGTFYTEYNPGPVYSNDYSGAASFTDWIVSNSVVASNPDRLDGVSYQRSKVTLAQVSDGSSNTLLMGEKYVPSSAYETGEFAADNETWCTGWNNDNSRGVLGNALTQFRYVPVADGDDPATLVQPGDRFGSAHASVWIAALCDGSARGIRFEADPQLLRRLASRLDGETVDHAAF